MYLVYHIKICKIDLPAKNQLFGPAPPPLDSELMIKKKKVKSQKSWIWLGFEPLPMI